MHVVCLFISYASPLILPSLFPYLSPPLLIVSFENRPASFRSRILWKATKPGSIFLCLFCVVVYFFRWWMHAFVVLGLVFSIPSQEIGFGKCLRNDLFCVEWDENCNSVNQAGIFMETGHLLWAGIFSKESVMVAHKLWQAADYNECSTWLLCLEFSDKILRKF